MITLLASHPRSYAEIYKPILSQVWDRVLLPERRALTGIHAAPSPEMYVHAVRASLGDDVYDEPCTKLLEQHMAKLTGKEAALFVPSGTMSNQLALRTHLKQPPYSVLCDHRAHIARSVHNSIRIHSA